MAILSSAELLRQAKNYSGSGDYLDEADGHDAQFGTGTPGTNDPQPNPWDGENYVYLPGVSGNYVSTPDVNLLPSDDAHGEQSIGGWGTQGTNTIAVVTDTDNSLVHPFFAKGGFKKVFKVTYQDDQDLADLTLPTLTAAGHIFICSVWFPSNWDGGNVTIDDNGTFASETSVSVQDAVGATTGSWQTVWRKFTPDAGDLVGTLTLASASAPTAGRVMYIAMNCVRADQVTTQVPSVRIVGDIDITTSIQLDDYTSGSDQYTFGRYGNTGATRAFQTRILGDGDMQFTSVHGGGSSHVVKTPSVAFVDGTRYKIRYQKDVSTGDVEFFVDDVSQGTANGITAAIDVSPFPLVINGGNSNLALLGTINLFTGSMYFAEIRDGIDGPVVARYDAADAAEPFATQTGATDGRTWTYNRSGAGLYVVDQASFGRHTDDYFETPDHADLDFAANEDFTAFIVIRANDATPAADEVLLAKKADLSTAAGYAIYLDTTGVPTGIIADGSVSTEAVGGALSDRILYVIAFKRDTGADKITVYTDGVAGTPVTDTTTATLANAEVLRTGRLSGAGTNYANGSEFADVLFRSALSDADIILVGTELEELITGTKGLMLLGVA